MSTNTERKKKLNTSSGEEASFKIVAKIVDRLEGAKTIEGIRMIRVKSHNHNLLIMEDFMPVIGEICGKIEFIQKDDIITEENIYGFYMHKKNEFSLVIENHEGKIPEKHKG